MNDQQLIMKLFTAISLFFFAITAKGQELYVFSEPASNMPARSVSVRIRGEYMKAQPWHTRSMQRIMPELMFGVNKKLMLHVNASFGNMHTNSFTWESVGTYLKYRFYSRDEIHQHFRMAAFAEAAYSRSPFHQDDVNIGGDKSGVQAGLIATQLWNKFALSGTVGHTQIFHSSRHSKNVIYVPSRIYQAMSYSLSGGYLLFPRQYSDYKQTNLNLYLEFLAQQSLDRSAYFIDIAPAIQLIFNSNTKLNIGYRSQLSGTMYRMANSSWLISIERTFLNALKKKS